MPRLFTLKKRGEGQAQITPPRDGVEARAVLSIAFPTVISITSPVVAYILGPRTFVTHHHGSCIRQTKKHPRWAWDSMAGAL